MKKIRLLLADDHPIVRKGLVQLFREEDDLEVVSECSDGEAALSGIREIGPDVAVIDLRMPRLTGLEVLLQLKDVHDGCPVILLAGNISDNEVIQAMRAGVKGIVLKEMAPHLLVQSIRKVAAGGVWLEKDAVGRALEKLLVREEHRQTLSDLLTNREVEILRMVAEGLGNREIAEKLFISEATVKSHIHAVYEKAGVKGRVQLATYARESGIL